MADSTEQPAQRKRQFRIPTVEDIEKSRKDAEKRLAPVECMRNALSFDLSSSTLQPSAMANAPISSGAVPLTAPPIEAQTSLSQPATIAGSRAPPIASPAGGGGGRGSGQIVLVNELQRGNPVLECVRNVRWSYSKDIIPDYVVGRTSCVLYLSVKYHRLHPEYISKRIDGLGKNYRLRVLLIHVDTDDCKIPLREINRIAVVGEMTILLAWSLDEAGRYIETLKVFEHRQPDIIRERVEDTYMARLANSLTSIKSVNKTDVLTLSSNYGSFEGVAKATSDELSLCPGVGDLKAQRIFKAFHEPFIPEK
ncbi:ssDNA endonuclease and repair protein rad10 [Coemansia sp. S100]|nr:ssDNA endonuclease and repair protein rad10 [Coemansia sp. S17]KAJ2094919.1 ssDNA endonuclease and repair protein rad10 [Coemansia sp. S142-1]KAJ2104224.1 ssDNA endonuclease and repair protein rad10 [Coemansia sp. S100]